MSAEEAAAASAEAAGAAEARPIYKPEEVLAALKDVKEHTFASKSLLSALQKQVEILMLIKAMSGGQVETNLAGLDRVIQLFLKNMYDLASAVPNSLMFDALEDLLARSGYLVPFLQGAAQMDGTMVLKLGIPSEDKHETLCDTPQELIRLAATGICCYYHYTNFPAHPDAFPSDDALLLFTTMALNSCVDPRSAGSLEQQLKDSGSPVSLAEIRWLMHWFRGHSMGLMGSVLAALGDTVRFKEHLVAQQGDWLGLLKAAPENPAGYPLYVRSCLQFQQLSAAALFAQKGAVVAERLNAQVQLGQLRAQRAVALALGAAAPQAGRSDAGPGVVTFRAGEVRALAAGAKEAVHAELAVLPPVYHELLALGQDLVVLDAKVAPLLEGAADGDAVPALVDLRYATPPPQGLPRGAVSVGKPTA